MTIAVPAWWPSHPPPAFEVLLPPGVDLVVLNGAPLELAGRIALHGRVLFDDDPPARVRNVLVRDYVEVDDGIVLERLTNLTDLDDFVAVVATWVVPPRS